MSEPRKITVWWCDQCGYWRKEESTRIHQTNDPDDWRGRMVQHHLRPVEFVAGEDLLSESPSSAGASS